MECPTGDWLPYKLIKTADGTCVVKWFYAGEAQFADPFFEDTVSKCLSHPLNSKGFSCITSLSLLAEFSEEFSLPERAPVFIYHISRCGSTLVSQAVSLTDKFMILSEMPLIDEILKLDEQVLNSSANDKRAWLRGIINLYGKRMNRRVLVKTDCWHIFHFRFLQSVFPASQLLFLFRNPAEVVQSHLKKPGGHTYPGALNLNQLNFTFDAEKPFHHKDYLNFLINRYLEEMVAIWQSNQNIQLLDYNAGILSLIPLITTFLGIRLSDEMEQKIKKRLSFHSKNPEEIFSAENEVLTGNAKLSGNYLKLRILAYLPV